jgi:23S rRNA maturation-related 3'-5' exoribonuclease YhaM
MGASLSEKKGPDSFMLRNQARIEKLHAEQQARDDAERKRLGKAPPASVKRQTARKEALERKRVEEEVRKQVEDEQREKLAAALREMEDQKQAELERQQYEEDQLKAGNSFCLLLHVCYLPI